MPMIIGGGLDSLNFDIIGSSVKFPIWKSDKPNPFDGDLEISTSSYRYLEILADSKELSGSSFSINCCATEESTMVLKTGPDRPVQPGTGA
jgi:hypothetical protein